MENRVRRGLEQKYTEPQQVISLVFPEKEKKKKKKIVIENDG